MAFFHEEHGIWDLETVVSHGEKLVVSIFNWVRTPL
jgi:hypothetical protein